MRLSMIAGLAALALVNAGPVAATVTSAPACSKVFSSVHKYTESSAVKTFCRSYLHIKTTTTTTKPTVTPAASTSTVTSTFTNLIPTTTTSISTVTSTATTTSVVTPDASTVTVSSTSTTTINCFETDTTTLTAYTVTTDPFVKRDAATTVPVPPVFSGYNSAALTQACDCYKPYSSVVSTVTSPTTLAPATSTTTITTTTNAVVTSTATSTTTVTTTSTALSTTDTPTVTSTQYYVQPTPGGSGMLYFAYYGDTDYDEATPGFDPSQYQQNTNFESSGIQYELADVGSSSDTGGTCYMDDGNEVNCDPVAIVFQGFFYAAETGSYTFYTPDTIDNELMFFHGNLAYGTGDTWSTANADYNALRANNPYGFTGGSVAITLNAGQILPITIIFGNSSPQSNLYIYIYTPDGTEYGGTGGFFSPQCDANGAFQP